MKMPYAKRKAVMRCSFLRHLIKGYNVGLSPINRQSAVCVSSTFNNEYRIYYLAFYKYKRMEDKEDFQEERAGHHKTL